MNVIGGVAFAALIIGAVLVQFWPTIAALSGGSAAFLGALVGAAAGLGAILAGALYNAKLNRDENRRLRSEHARTLAIGLRAELITLMDDAADRVSTVEELRATDDSIRPTQIAVLDLPAKVVFASNTDRLGDLAAIGSVQVIAAHARADHIRNNVAAARAHAPTDFVDDNALRRFEADFRQLVEDGAVGVNALNAFLGELTSYPNPGAVLEQIKSAAASGQHPKASTK